VVIFEDNIHLRESLAFLINASDDFVCVNAHPNARQALLHIKAEKPQVVVMDIEMPFVDGIEATALIKGEYPETQILILTAFDDNDKIFRSLCAGGSGYLLKDSSPEQIIQALNDVVKGGSALSPSVAKRVVNFFQRSKLEPSEMNNLTPKEKETLQHLVDGKSYKMAADAMNISIETVKSHIKTIYRKLHVNSSSEAVAKAIRQGFFNN